MYHILLTKDGELSLSQKYDNLKTIHKNSTQRKSPPKQNT